MAQRGIDGGRVKRERKGWKERCREWMHGGMEIGVEAEGIGRRLFYREGYDYRGSQGVHHLWTTDLVEGRA